MEALLFYSSVFVCYVITVFYLIRSFDGIHERIHQLEEQMDLTVKIIKFETPFLTGRIEELEDQTRVTSDTVNLELPCLRRRIDSLDASIATLSKLKAKTKKRKVKG